MKNTKIHRDFAKVCKVIESCKTIDHKYACENIIYLFYKFYKNNSMFHTLLDYFYLSTRKIKCEKRVYNENI